MFMTNSKSTLLLERDLNCCESEIQENPKDKMT